MKTFAEVNGIHVLNAILAKHNRTVVADGRLLTLIHRPDKGRAEISRHVNIPALAKSIVSLDERLTQFV